MKESQHFKKSELQCRCGCGLYIVTIEFLIMLENFRARLNEHFNTGPEQVMSTHSCIRCQAHNQKEGGTDIIENGVHKVSLHVPKYIDAVTGRKISRNTNAYDFHVPRISIRKLHVFALSEHNPNKTLYGGLFIYDWGCHIDNGPYRFGDKREKC
jgi:hypothetical protein